MKKYLLFSLLLLLALSLSACAGAVDPQTLYSFPEPTTEIYITRQSQGRESSYTLTKEEEVLALLNWYYGLHLREVKQNPEPVEGNEFFAFRVDGSEIFSYDDRGSEAYLYVQGKRFQVRNPSSPPWGQ